jgi:hypothetical protein
MFISTDSDADCAQVFTFKILTIYFNRKAKMLASNSSTLEKNLQKNIIFSLAAQNPSCTIKFLIFIFRRVIIIFSTML